MRYYFSILFLLFFIIIPTSGILLGDEQSKSNNLDYFRKLQESAHPTPVQQYIPYKGKGAYSLKQNSVAILDQYSLPKFINSSTTVDGNSTGAHQNESSIAVSPINPDFLIGSAVDYRQSGDTWIYISRDGGNTWENKSLGKPFPTWRSTNDPSVHFDTQGNAYLMYGGFPGQGAAPETAGQNGVFMSVSYDEGVNWETHKPVILHDKPMLPDSTFEDKYYIHIDNSPESPYQGNIYTPWKRVTPLDSATQIVFTRSEDGGDIWSLPIDISNRMAGTSEDTTFGQSFPLVTTDSKGNIYAVWNNGIVHGVGFNRSSDAGITWESERIIHNYDIFGETLELDQGWRHTVKGMVRAEAYPVIEVNLAEGIYKDEIYVIWAADNPPNIYFSKSKDQGDTWSSPIIVHETETNDQWWPWLGVDPESGDIAVMYLDSRNDPENIMTECYVSYSQDGGNTWIDRKASSAPFDVRKNPFQGRSFAGDYSGLDFRNGIIYPSWVDMRNVSSATGWDSDVYTAIMDTKDPSPAEDFIAATIPAQPDQVKLTWKSVLETTFGKEIDPTELRYEIYRGEDLVNIVPSVVTELFDTAPEPFTAYNYSIRSIYGERKSISREAVGYAGGAKEPLPPILSAQDIWLLDEYSVDIEIPSKRLDSVTPLVNAESLDIYLDDDLYKNIEIMPTDTANTINISDKISTEGYQLMSAILVADFSSLGFGTQRSPISNTQLIATGNITEYYFAEEDIDNRKLVVDDLWKPNSEFYRSGTQSVMIGGENRYPKNTTAQFLMPPVLLDDNPKYFHFSHLVQIAPNDSALVQISTDLKEWQTIKSYSRLDKESWSVSELTGNDWVMEHIRIDSYGSPGETIFVRLKFESDNFLEMGEWIVDNIQIDGTTTSVEDSEEVSLFKVHYDMLTGKIYLTNTSGISELLNASLYDINGKMISQENNVEISGGRTEVLFANSVPSIFPYGVYILMYDIGGTIYTIPVHITP